MRVASNEDRHKNKYAISKDVLREHFMAVRDNIIMPWLYDWHVFALECVHNDFDN